MKKYLLGLSVVSVVALAAFHKQVKEVVLPEAPVSKSISIAVFADKNYSSAVYNDALAMLHITVTKVKGNKRTLVWDKTFDAKLLRDYPSFENALTQKIVVDNVSDNREKLEVVYTLTYTNKGSVLQMFNSTLFTKGQHSGKLYINI